VRFFVAILAPFAVGSCSQAQTVESNITAESVTAFAQCAAKKLPRKLYGSAVGVGHAETLSVQFVIENETDCKMGKLGYVNVSEMAGIFAQALFLSGFQRQGGSKLQSGIPIVDLAKLRALPNGDRYQGLKDAALLDCVARSDEASALILMKSPPSSSEQNAALEKLSKAWGGCANEVGVTAEKWTPIVMRGELQRAIFRRFVGFEFLIESVS
jgi:hypothetical protein